MAYFISKFRNYSTTDKEGKIQFIQQGLYSFYKTEESAEIERLKKKSNFGKDFYLSNSDTLPETELLGFNKGTIVETEVDRLKVDLGVKFNRYLALLEKKNQSKGGKSGLDSSEMEELENLKGELKINVSN